MNFLDWAPPSVEENLALDEAMLVEVEEGRQAPHLRLWELRRPAVVLGASGGFQRDVIVEACRADGVPIARRSSGGGTVVIGPGALNFAVVLPRHYAPGLDAVDQTQHYVLERVASALRGHGAPVEVRGSGDLTVEHRKVAGSAQRRLKDHFLVHATILYDFPLDLIDRYTRPPERQPAYREGRSHLDFVANLGLSRPSLKEALRSAWDAAPPTGPVRWPLHLVNELVATKFGDPTWTERF